MSTDELPPREPKYDYEHPLLGATLCDLRVPNEEFTAWQKRVGPRLWAKFDLSAARVGWEAALAARADLEERLKDQVDIAAEALERENYLTAQLALRDAEVERLRGCAISIKAMGDEMIAQRDERIRELEEAKQLSEWDHESWAKARQRAEAAEARVRELEQIHEEEWRNLKAERDALRAQIEAIRKQPTVVVFNGAGSWIVHSPIQIGKELIERPELP